MCRLYRQKRILNTLELIFQQWAQYDLWEQFFSGRALWGTAWGPIPTVVGSSVSFIYSCWSLQRDLCVWGDSEGVSEFSEQVPGSSTQISNLGSSDLGIRSGMSYRTSGKNYAKRQERKPHENSSGLTRPCSMLCLCTVAGIKWYLGFISILVWRLHFCELQEDSLWGAAAPLRGRALWGTCAAELPFCFLRKQNLWILLN